MNKPLIVLMAPILALAAAQAQAAGKTDEPQRCPATEASTVFVPDATMRRHDGSAGRITQAHQDAEKEGWAFADLEVYTENGDLQGFFITYTRPHSCNAKAGAGP